MDTATDGKTYVLTDLDVKLPTRPERDTMRVKLDMGAEANILPVRTYNKMFPDRVLEDGTPDPKYLQPTHIEFECSKDSIIRSLGCINLDIAAPGKKLINSHFFVSSHHNQILIGHPSCDRLGAYTLHMQNKAPPFKQNKLLPQLSEVNQTGTTEGRIRSVADLMKRYPKQFDVIGKFDGEYHIVTDPNVQPSQHAMCKVPVEYQKKIEKELDRMEEQGIITKVTEPTEWVNFITYPVKPNGDLRICLDPKDLNKAIIREHYKAPTLEEITHKLCGATKFSKVDCYKGFFAYLMDKASSMKTTFNTIPGIGRYRYLRVPMAAKYSQDAYQMKMDQILEGLQGVIAIHDGITIYGKGDEDHDANLITLMERAKETGLTLNSKKCSIGQDSVSFFGVIFGKDEMCPDLKKIQGILEMPPPKDTTQLQSFLGMVNFMHNFIPHLSEHLQQSVLTQHCSGNWEPATIQKIGPEPRSYLCTTNSGTVLRRNRRQIHETGLPDQKGKLQPSSTTTAAKKSVRWSDDVYITVDAESAYSLATQGIQLFQSQTTANNPIAAVAPVAPVPAAVAVPVPPAEPELPYAETDEDNQSHFSDSE